MMWELPIFSVTDLAVRTGHADGFSGSEDFLVVVDGLRRAPYDQVRRDGVVVLGNVRDFGCHDVLLKNVGWRWGLRVCTRQAVGSVDFLDCGTVKKD
jgi:hypothetical protein